MPKYRVVVAETLEYEVIVEAEDQEAANLQVTAMCEEDPDKLEPYLTACTDRGIEAIYPVTDA